MQISLPVTVTAIHILLTHTCSIHRITTSKVFQTSDWITSTGSGTKGNNLVKLHHQHSYKFFLLLNCLQITIIWLNNKPRLSPVGINKNNSPASRLPKVKVVFFTPVTFITSNTWLTGTTTSSITLKTLRT